MKLDLSERDETLRGAAAAFAEERVVRSLRDLEHAASVPPTLLADAAAHGLTAAAVPSTRSSESFDAIGTAVVVERLARRSAPVGLAVGLSNACASVLKKFDEGQSARAWLTRLITGEAACAVTRSSQDDVRLTHGAGQTATVSGRLPSVPNARTAGLLLVVLEPAHNDASASRGPRSLLALPLDGPGVGRLAVGDGVQPGAAGWTDVSLENAAADVSRDVDAALSVDTWIRVLSAAIAVGVGRSALEQAIAVLKAQPLYATQGVTFGLADSATELDAAWLMTLKAASSVSAGDVVAAAMARLLASEAAEVAVDRAMKALLAADRGHAQSMMRWWYEARLGDVWLGPPAVERRTIGEALQRS